MRISTIQVSGAGVARDGAFVPQNPWDAEAYLAAAGNLIADDGPLSAWLIALVVWENSLHGLARNPCMVQHDPRAGRRARCLVRQ